MRLTGREFAERARAIKSAQRLERIAFYEAHYQKLPPAVAAHHMGVTIRTIRRYRKAIRERQETESMSKPGIRMMFDAANPANIPAHATMIAWYPGMWEVTAAEAFPRATAVSIAQHPDQLDCDVLDIERFDATVDDLPGWIEAKRKRHDRWHGAYCSLSIAADVVPILRRTSSGLWCAEWTGEPHQIVVEGFTASAVQYLNNKNAGYDVSAVYQASWHRAP